jgi:hypothetical protein
MATKRNSKHNGTSSTSSFDASNAKDHPSLPASVGKTDPLYYGQQTGHFLGVWTTHALPLQGRPVRYVVMAVLVLIWFLLFGFTTKCVGIFHSTVYSAVEFIFCRFKYGEFYTTAVQWFLNVLYLPFLHLYCFPYLEHSMLLFTLVFPLQVWLLEIIQGYLLIWFYGHNVAWSYSGSDAYFHGNIKLKMYHWWAILGFFVILVWPTSQLVRDHIEQLAQTRSTFA